MPRPRLLPAEHGEQWQSSDASASQAMARYADGDDAAFAAVYDSIAPRVHAYLRRQTHDAILADDLLQQTLASDPVHPHTAGAALGAAIGAGTWVLVDLWCPVAYVSHLLLGHVLPLVLTILCGAALGGRLLRLQHAKRHSEAS